MHNLMQHRRVVGTLMVGIMTAALIAPAAQAGGRRSGSVAGYGVQRVPVRSHVSYANHSSGAGPLIAGLVGGIVIGSILSNSSSHASVSAGYSYYDPYCEVSYGSLNSYRSHFGSCDHPYVARVMQRGQFVQDVCWQNSNWHDYRGSWGNSGGYGNHGRSHGGGYGHRDGGWNRGGDRDGRGNRGHDGWNNGGRRNDGDRRYKDDRRGDNRDWRNNDRRGDDDRWNDDGRNRTRRDPNDIWDEDRDGTPNSRDQYDRDPRRN